MAIIHGTPGNDKNDKKLVGTAQDDQINGYEGDDELIGGSGRDYLTGGSGNDILTGGPGRDTFILYFSGGGIDTITDFKVGEDFIDVTTPYHPPIDYLKLDNGLRSDTFFLYYLDSDTGIKYTDITPTIRSSDVDLLQGKIVTNYISGPISDGRVPSSNLTYDKNTGALYYGTRQLAWLPLNLPWATQSTNLAYDNISAGYDVAIAIDEQLI